MVEVQGESSFPLGASERILGSNAEAEKSVFKAGSCFSPKEPQLKCPECGGSKLYRDGMRYLSNGESVQRRLCRVCGYRFSEKRAPQSGQPLKKTLKWHLKTKSTIAYDRQVCVLARGAKNLDSKILQEIAQREGTTTQLTSQLLDYAWQAKKRGLAEQTIRQRVYKLKLLAKKGADLNNSDSVLTVLANSTWTQANKRTIIIAYSSFAKTYKIQWEPPKTRVERKIPYIPTEQEISQLIAGCGRKTAALLQMLKDTAARTAEAVKVKWTDIDENKYTIRINNPVKGSLARIVKVTPNTIAMLNHLPKTGEYIFNTNPDTVRKNFTKQRNKIARNLQNPKLKQIHLHTLRHWKATMEYHRTKNIKHVQQMLGHKKNRKHRPLHTTAKL
jgi:integrase/rubredoxin